MLSVVPAQEQEISRRTADTGIQRAMTNIAILSAAVVAEAVLLSSLRSDNLGPGSKVLIFACFCEACYYREKKHAQEESRINKMCTSE